MKRPLTLACVLLTLLPACTFTTKRTKIPQFTSSTDSLNSLGRQIGQFVSCEHINLDGNEITANGKTSSELEIDIINGKNVPADTARMRSLGESIASVVRSGLQDVDEYDSYQVLFMTVESTSVGTKRKWTGMTYKAEELTVKKLKDPVFAGSKDSLFLKLGKFLACEKFKTVGWMVTRNDESNSEMYIEVINGKKVPEEDDRLKALGKIIAGDFKHALADTTEYGLYNIYFVTEEGDTPQGKARIVTLRSFEL
jgi:hypothetical protein